ncbi:hypothetical protein GCM10023192_52450 [Amycolatopsis samaneae]
MRRCRGVPNGPFATLNDAGGVFWRPGVLKDAIGALSALKASFSAANALKASFSTQLVPGKANSIAHRPQRSVRDTAPPPTVRECHIEGLRVPQCGIDGLAVHPRRVVHNRSRCPQISRVTPSSPRVPIGWLEGCPRDGRGLPTPMERSARLVRRFAGDSFGDLPGDSSGRFVR